MIRVRIPATTANLGPGFDCMGLALDLWNTFELHVAPPGGGPRSWRVETHGEGAGELSSTEDNLLLTVMRDELKRLGAMLPREGKVIVHNAIPVASGLGSSSTATLAGLLFAHAIARAERDEDPSKIDREAVLEQAVAVEGHGDNVAPALLGGFVIVVPDAESGVIVQRIPHVPMGAVVCVPKVRFLTSEARAVMPNEYSKSDAIFNIGRAMLVAEALRAGDDRLLARAMQDRIHEPYRIPLVGGASEAREEAKARGAIAVALSGAGPGMIAFTRSGFDRIGQGMKEAFARAGTEARYWVLDATSEGAHIGRLPV